MSRADKEAADLLKQTGTDTTPVDPGVVAERLGVNLVTENMPMDVSGMLLRQSGMFPAIGVNGAHSPDRQRFSLAHALGHLRMHRSRPVLLDTDTRVGFSPPALDMGSDREEAEANRFAVALLAPEPQVSRFVQDADFRDARHLTRLTAQHFHVSETIAAHRLIVLGITLDPTEGKP